MRGWKSIWSAARSGTHCSGARCASATTSSSARPRTKLLAAGLSGRSAATSRCSCTRRRTPSTRWRAASARPGRAIAASSPTSRRTSRSRKTCCGGTSPINAIAQRADGTLVDPYGGQADLAARTLRHVSPAFSEDPVRVLRVARFAARFAPLGFTVHESTRALMRPMVEDGEIAALVPERVWQETERALGGGAAAGVLRGAARLRCARR